MEGRNFRDFISIRDLLLFSLLGPAELGLGLLFLLMSVRVAKINDKLRTILSQFPSLSPYFASFSFKVTTY